MKRYYEDRLCAKCGWKAVGSVYCTQQMAVFIGGTPHPFVPEAGHIHRDCGRCGHRWLERALDAPALDPAERDRILADLRQRARDAVFVSTARRR